MVCLPDDKLFKETIMGQAYLQMLEIMIPHLNYLFENENEVYFQQDRASPHFHFNVRNFLDRTFNIDRMKRTAMEFPPLFLNLIPLDFYLWGTLKNIVNATKPQTLEELIDQIEHTINDIPLTTIQTVCCSERHHRWECSVAEGGHFEYVQA